MRTHRASEIISQEKETPPEGTATVVWAGAPDSAFRFPPERYEECVPDDFDFSEDRRGIPPRILIDPGEEVPLPVAEDHWHGHTDMVAFDEDGNRLDNREASNPAAIDHWQDRQ